MNYVNYFEAPAAELELYTALKENQLAHIFEPSPGLFIAESPQVIRMALEAGYEPYSLLLEKEKAGRVLEELFPISEEKRSSFVEELPEVTEKLSASVNRSGKRGAAVCKDIPVYLAEHDELKTLTGYELTGGALAAFRRKKLPEAEALLNRSRRVVVLESVMNPRNIGSIFRSAAAIGYDAILLTKGSADPLYRRAARVSMGTVFSIPWTFMDDVTALKGTGFVTVAMALTDNSVSMDDPVLKGHEKLAVLMGSEKTGLKEETIANASYTAKIPMKHGVDSLNVAAASAIAFWELRGN